MTLPVLRSLADPAALQGAFDLPAPPRLIRSHVNDTYVCGDTVLRVYEPGRSASRIAGELNALTQLKAAGVPVAAALSTEPISLELPEGVRYAALFERASGIDVHAARSEEAVAALGRAIAQMHAATVEVTGRPVLVAAFSAHQLVQTVRDAMPEVELPSIDLPDLADIGLIHGDADSSNALVAAGVATLIDFDDCAIGPRLYDVACLLVELERWAWPRLDAMREAFLGAYLDVRTLDTSHLRPLQALRCLWLLERHASRLDAWGTFRVSPRFVDRLVRDLRSYCD